jgi:hypothetical protein
MKGLQVMNTVNHIRAFFAEYSSFDYNERAGTGDEFRRLVEQQGWNNNQVGRRRARLAGAVGDQFEHIYGNDANDLPSLCRLAADAGVQPPPETVAACKKVSCQSGFRW